MARRTRTDPAAIEAVLDLAYDVALDPDSWPALLRGLAALFDAHFADSFRRTVDYGRFEGVAVGLDMRDYQDLFLDTWVKRNVWGQRRPVVRAGEIVATRAIIAPADLRRTEMYNDYLGPRDLHEGLRLDLRVAGGWIEDVSILRPWSAGPFTSEELRVARTLLPHLQRATAMSKRVARDARRGELGLAALDLVPTAFVLLDRSMRILHANRAADLLRAEADGIGFGTAGFLVVDPSVQRRLETMLMRAVDRRDARGCSGSLRIERISGKAALVVNAVPFRAGGAALPAGDGRDAAIVVCITDPDRQPTLRRRELALLFGLTDAEAGLALDLLSGCDLKAIAARTDRSINTVRSLLARVMAKTDTGRQPDLIRLLMTLPSLAGAEGDRPPAGEVRR